MALADDGRFRLLGLTTLSAEDESKVRMWIRQNMVPSELTDHFHTSKGLRIMVNEDTRVAVSEADFRKIVVDEGFRPVDPIAKEWEFRISKTPFRRRSEASVGGWMPSMAKNRMTRMS